jgi:hypothetical protein
MQATAPRIYGVGEDADGNSGLRLLGDICGVEAKIVERRDPQLR